MGGSVKKEHKNDFDIREKNCLAAIKSRKKQKIAKQTLESQVNDLSIQNQSLTMTVHLLSQQTKAHLTDKQRLNAEISTLRIEKEKAREELLVLRTKINLQKLGMDDEDFLPISTSGIKVEEN